MAFFRHDVELGFGQLSGEIASVGKGDHSVGIAVPQRNRQIDGGKFYSPRPDVLNKVAQGTCSAMA